MSSGKYVSTPPRDMNQKIAANCPTTSESVSRMLKMNGRLCSVLKRMS